MFSNEELNVYEYDTFFKNIFITKSLALIKLKNFVSKKINRDGFLSKNLLDFKKGC